MSAADKFHMRSASLTSVLPAVTLPAIGGYAGRALGTKFLGPSHGADLGTLDRKSVV